MRLCVKKSEKVFGNLYIKGDLSDYRVERMHIACEASNSHELKTTV